MFDFYSLYYKLVQTSLYYNMGVVSSHKELIVATVNYSGILHSPYEFYSQESYQEEEKLSRCFRKLLEQTHLNFDVKTFKWGLGKIDQKLQRERYAVIYRQSAGIEGGKLVNQNEFRKRWREEFGNAKKQANLECTAEQISNAENFDLMCYRAFIMYVYNEKDLQKAPKLDVDKYKKFQHKFFSKSFLNQKQKIRLTFQAMHKQDVDVFFFQESTQEFENELEKKQQFVSYKASKSGSLIVLKKHKFRKFHRIQKIFTHVKTQLFQELNINGDSSICFVDNFIFYNLHLSSKKEKNPQQVKKLVEVVGKLREAFPMCQVIGGGDINSYLAPDYLPKQMHVFPNTNQMVTTMKKRTWLQPQVIKADQLCQQSKDSLFSTLPMNKPRVVTIQGVDSKKIHYIPNQQHPCDHFVVTANIQISP